jgi:predicted RNA-binding protein with RPS1 domain
MIRSITEQSGAKIEIQDDGTINIASSDPLATKRAIALINDICAEAEVGKTYKGKVVKIADFGAFVEILPNTQGLLHISEIAHDRIRQVTDVLSEGDEIDVKVLDVDRAGRIKLSRKALLESSAKPDNGVDKTTPNAIVANRHQMTEMGLREFIALYQQRLLTAAKRYKSRATPVGLLKAPQTGGLLTYWPRKRMIFPA